VDSTFLNADFSRRVVVHTGLAPWIKSPGPGVERKPLDRIGGEIARATSIVRYAPGAAFPAHVLQLGEEFLVLEGVFSDQLGDYPEGTYVRNPPCSGHAPGTSGGCVIFVKLRQMHAQESARVVIDTRKGVWSPGAADGHAVQTLHALRERVALERLEAGARLPDEAQPHGEEILVLEGTLADEEGSYPARTWIRNPAGHRRRLQSSTGAVYWVKRGHLPPQS